MRRRPLAIVLAGGQGSRLDVLTRERAKPAMPVGGTHHLIDVVLSNVAHSGVDDVWLAVQYLAAGLLDRVAGGRPWDLDRTHGGLRLVLPEEGRTDEHGGFATGNADQLFRLADRIRVADPSHVVVLSSDHVYRLDLRDVLATHEAAEAECTLVTTRVPRDQASHHLVVHAEQDSAGARVTAVDYKPERASTGIVGTEVIVYSPAALLEVLAELHRGLSDTAEPGDSGLVDFGEHLVPALVARGRTVAHPLGGYWKDLGRPEAYLACHHDLIDGTCDVFADPTWPMLSPRAAELPAARVRAGAVIEDSLLSPGCEVAGTVRRSTIGPGVVVEPGAVVADSVLLDGVHVGNGAVVRWAVVDERTRIGARARVGAAPTSAPAHDDEVTLVGRECQVAGGAVVRRGGRCEPGTIVGEPDLTSP